MHILFADDVADTRFIFRTSFEIAGHSMLVTNNGIEAITAVQEQVFDAIIMDLSMPEMDGWQATRKIRQLPNGVCPPIIIFTAHSRQGLSRKALQVGADYVLEKPMTPRELRKFVEDIIAKRTADTTRATSTVLPVT